MGVCGGVLLYRKASKAEDIMLLRKEVSIDAWLKFGHVWLRRLYLFRCMPDRTLARLLVCNHTLDYQPQTGKPENNTI